MTPPASEQENNPRGRGRPREFDMDKALDAAIGVFRERGYHAASVSDLTEVTALASGSIYKAFKDKRALFLAAFDRYVALSEQARNSSLQPNLNGLESLRVIMHVYVEVSSGMEGRRGCLVVGSAMELKTLDTEIVRRVTDALARMETSLADIIRRGQADGSIAADRDAAAAARLMHCILQGMRVVGKVGKTREEMTAVVDLALKVVT